MVASGITHIELHVTNDRIGPIKNIEATIRSDLHADWSKTRVRRLKELHRQGLGPPAGTDFLKVVPPQTMEADALTCDKSSLDFFWQMR